MMGAESAIAAQSKANSLDDIRVFLGEIPDDEYAVRLKLRTARNAASWRVTNATSDHARTLLWMGSSVAAQWVYAPADIETLTEISEYCRRLLALAEQAEILGAG